MTELHECAHFVKNNTLRTKSNGTTCVVPQCEVCGYAFPELPKAGHDIASLSRFDEDLRPAWEARGKEIWRINYSAEQKAKSDSWWENYSAYLEGEHWRSVRRIVLARDTICQCCFRNRANEAHHLSYATFKKYGFSFPQECVGVCTGCHRGKIHQERPE